MGNLTINLNKLYAPDKPYFECMELYEDKIKNLLKDIDYKEVNIVITGTGPLWLMIGVITYLIPWVASITYTSNETMYRIVHVNENKLTMLKEKKI